MLEILNTLAIIEALKALLRPWIKYDVVHDKGYFISY